jgi:hypothetical protein
MQEKFVKTAAVNKYVAACPKGHYATVIERNQSHGWCYKCGVECIELDLTNLNVLWSMETCTCGPGFRRGKTPKSSECHELCNNWRGLSTIEKTLAASYPNTPPLMLLDETPDQEQARRFPNQQKRKRASK